MRGIVICMSLVCSVFVLSETAFVDSLQKCSIKDDACMRDLYQTIVQGIGETGIPELGIPPVDPIDLRNVTVSILGLVDITLLKGVATGVKSCVFDQFHFDVVKETGSQKITCDILIEGKYKVYSESPLVKTLFGGTSIHGEGNGKVALEKLHMKFDFPANVQKRDGEIYINCDFKKINYDYEILGKTKFFADNIYLGEQEASKLIIGFLNDNWKFIMRTFGRAFMDKAMEFYFNFAGKFFNAVPTSKYISDDLAPYVKNL